MQFPCNRHCQLLYLFSGKFSTTLASTCEKEQLDIMHEQTQFRSKVADVIQVVYTRVSETNSVSSKHFKGHWCPIQLER